MRTIKILRAPDLDKMRYGWVVGAALLVLASGALAGKREHVPGAWEKPFPAPLNTENVNLFIETVARAWAAEVKRNERPDMTRIVRAALLEARPFVDSLEFARDDCDDCKVKARQIQALWLSDAVVELISQKAIDFCIRLRLFADYICVGAVELFADTVMTIVGHSALEPLEVCARRGLCTVEADPVWEAEFPVAKPPLRQNPVITPNTPRKYVLHLTDIHYVRLVDFSLGLLRYFLTALANLGSGLYGWPRGRVR